MALLRQFRLHAGRNSAGPISPSRVLCAAGVDTMPGHRSGRAAHQPALPLARTRQLLLPSRHASILASQRPVPSDAGSGLVSRLSAQPAFNAARGPALRSPGRNGHCGRRDLPAAAHEAGGAWAGWPATQPRLVLAGSLPADPVRDLAASRDALTVSLPDTQ